MRKRNPENERIKRRYLAYLEEAKRMDVSSVDQVAASLALFETSTGCKDFGAFHIEQARKFKRQLTEATNPATGKPLAKATAYSRLMALKAFYFWLAGQPKYKSRLTYSDAEYFNLSNNDARIAKATRARSAPTPEQIRHVIAHMPGVTDIEKRDRALLAFTILTGARDNAIASMSLRHVNIARREIDQDARDVRTKNRKTFTSYFFPVGADIEAIVAEWISFLMQERLFGPDDPLFPATCVAVGISGLFEQAGLKRAHWANADAIRRIFRQSFEAAGLPYFNPHCFRNTLVALGQQVCKTPEQLKCWSQNLGHEHMLTTLTSYGAVARGRQADILKTLGQSTDGRHCDAGEPSPFEVQRILAHLQSQSGLQSTGQA